MPSPRATDGGLIDSLTWLRVDHAGTHDPVEEYLEAKPSEKSRFNGPRRNNQVHPCPRVLVQSAEPSSMLVFLRSYPLLTEAMKDDAAVLGMALKCLPGSVGQRADDAPKKCGRSAKESKSNGSGKRSQGVKSAFGRMFSRRSSSTD